MATVPWATDCDLSCERVRAILARQFPGLADTSVEYLDEGWDNVVFEVDSSWLFRFPKRPEVEPTLLVERALLHRIGPLLPIPVPSFEWLGEPCDLFPRRFLGYRKLPGVTGDTVRPTPHLAGPLADFLVALHSFPVREALDLGVPGNTANRAFARLRERVVEQLDIFREAVPALVERARRFLDAPAPEPHAGEPRLLHADLTCSHILIEGSRVTGIIDWADVEVGDPAVDLSGLLHWGGEPLFRAVLERYPFADAGLASRARYTATCVGFFDIFYGVGAKKPDSVELGTRALELNLPV